MEKLSSGYRINRAADDAAGLAICEKMRGQIGGLAQAQRNAQDGVSLVQTAEGALTEVHSMLQRVRDLKVQYNNGTLSTDDRTAIESEVNQLGSEIERIGASAEFNGIKLLNSGSDDHVPGRRQRRRDDHGFARSRLGARGRRRRELLRCCRPPARPTSSEIDDAIDNVSRPALDVRRGAEPPRAPLEQPGDLPGEPDRVRDPDPRRGHGRGDGQVHEAEHPAAGRHEHARAGQPGARRASCRCCASQGPAHRTPLSRANGHLQVRHLGRSQTGRRLRPPADRPAPSASAPRRSDTRRT